MLEHKVFAILIVERTEFHSVDVVQQKKRLHIYSSFLPEER